MAKTENFDTLLQAIQSSFMKVNQLSQQQHSELLEQFFDSENKPISIKMQYPARGENGELLFNEVEIPKLCVVPISSLKLQEVSVDFKVKLAGKVSLKSGRADLKEDADGNKRKKGSLEESYVGYIPHAAKRGENTGFADIHLKFKADEPPEGIMRIRDSFIRVMP